MTEAEAGEVDSEDGTDDEDEDEAHLEVGSDVLAHAHLPLAAMVGSDVCLLHAAYPDTPLQTPGAIGWRAQVTGKGRDKTTGAPKVQVFGQWYGLENGSVIRPIEQLVLEEEEGEEDEEGEEAEEAGDGEEEAEEAAEAAAQDETGGSSKRFRPDSPELDSSGDEIQPRQMAHALKARRFKK